MFKNKSCATQNHVGAVVVFTLHHAWINVVVSAVLNEGVMGAM